MSGTENERRRSVPALPEPRLANAECLTGTFQSSHDGQLQLEQAEDASYLLTNDDAEPDADVDDQGDQPVDDDGEPVTKRNKKKTKGRVKISMEFIENKSRRYTTFSKRKTGLMKKAYELATLTGAQVMLLVASETGHVYTFATRKLQSMITSESGKALIQTCLNSPDSPSPAAVSSSPTPTPAPPSSNCTPSSLAGGNHAGSTSYLSASQSHASNANSGSYSQRNASYITKFDDAQFPYDSAGFHSPFAADELEGDESDSQSDAVGLRVVNDLPSQRFRKIAPSATAGQPKQNQAALRVSKPTAVPSTSAANEALRTKFVAVPTFHVADYANSSQLDSDG